MDPRRKAIIIIVYRLGFTLKLLNGANLITDHNVFFIVVLVEHTFLLAIFKEEYNPDQWTVKKFLMKYDPRGGASMSNTGNY